MTNNIVFHLHVYVGRSDGHLFNLFPLLRVFLVGLGNRSEFFGYFLEVSSNICKEMKYLLK